MKKYYVVFPYDFPHDFNLKVFYYNESLAYKHLYAKTTFGETKDKKIKKELNELKQFLNCNNMNDHVIILPNKKIYKKYLKIFDNIENSTYYWYTEDLLNMTNTVLFDDIDKQYINRLLKD